MHIEIESAQLYLLFNVTVVEMSISNQSARADGGTQASDKIEIEIVLNSNQLKT